MAGSLTLGSVVFADFEVPETLSIGGKQQLVIHSLPGGGRVVDAMGAAEGPIRWSGVFSGPQAAERVRALEIIRRGGQQQVLTWDAWRYSVIVQEFDAQITNTSWIPYQIRLCVISVDSLASVDYLDHAVPPTLTIGLITAAALEAGIGAAGLGLGSSDIGQAIGAAGNLAQLVTARAYGLVTT